MGTTLVTTTTAVVILSTSFVLIDSIVVGLKILEVSVNFKVLLISIVTGAAVLVIFSISVTFSVTFWVCVTFSVTFSVIFSTTVTLLTRISGTVTGGGVLTVSFGVAYVDCCYT